MPKRDQLLSELGGEQDYGVLLVAQMGGVPNQIDLIIQTAIYDEAAEGLRPRHTYIIRALGVREHRLTVGMFGKLRLLDEHPLLYHHNAPKVAVYFDGTPKDLNELVLDISQTHVLAYEGWRHLVDTDDINRSTPMTTLFKRGFGVLGVMPKPLAERIGKVLEHHGIKHTDNEELPDDNTDEHGRSRLAKLLLLDQSYIIALDFSVEELGKT
ncbi:MAG: hypothetical protein J0M07_01860 [Anaerolineae bacterium]|nr:hypothetical protein [Chloroflexota bacterium]MBN8634041.1 hypothetical protein [Anaerolineae bacterium]